MIGGTDVAAYGGQREQWEKKVILYSARVAESADLQSRGSAFEKDKSIREFEAAQRGQVLNSDDGDGVQSADEARSVASLLQAKSRASGGNLSTSDESKYEKAKTIAGLSGDFWLPEAAKFAAVCVGEDPGKFTPMCQAHNPHAIRLKHWVSAVFAPSVDSGTTKYSCPSCKKPLVNGPKVDCLSGCGHIICGKCVDEFVTKGCPVCGKKLKKRGDGGGIVRLRGGGTGYSSVDGEGATASRVEPMVRIA